MSNGERLDALSSQKPFPEGMPKGDSVERMVRRYDNGKVARAIADTARLELLKLSVSLLDRDTGSLTPQSPTDKTPGKDLL